MELLLIKNSQNRKVNKDISKLFQNSIKKTNVDVEFNNSREWAKEKFLEWRNNLTQSETNAIKIYTRSIYAEINEYMRLGEIPAKSKYNAETLDIYVNSISSALEKAIIPNDIIVYRGVSEGFIKRILGLDENVETQNHLDNSLDDVFGGKVIEDKAFMSTTFAPFVADWFSKNGHGIKASYVLKIFIPKGISGASLEGITLANREYEVLINKEYSLILKNFKKIKTFDSIRYEINCNLL